MKFSCWSNGSSSQLLPKNIIKLDRNNYILWKSQVLSTLRGHGLEGYVDGSHKCPSKFVASSLIKETSAEATINPNYLARRKHDQFLLSNWFLSTLTKSVLGQVVGCTIVMEVWQALELCSHHSQRRD